MIAKFQTTNESEANAADANSSKPEDEKVLGSILHRIMDASHSQYELISISGVVRGFYPYMVLQRDIVSKFAKDDNVVHRNGSLVIYGVSNAAVEQLRAARGRLDRASRGAGSLPSATLMSMVATFDSTMSELLREVFTLRPHLLRTGTKSLNFADVLSAHTIDELKDRILDDEVYQFSRESHEKQVQIIEERFGFAISKDWKRWPDFIEVFERRNLIAHGEKTFTNRYVGICKKHNHKGSETLLGEQIKLLTSYLRQSADVLLEFSLLLVFEIWRKHFSAEIEDVAKAINEISVKLISDDRSRVVDWVLDYITRLKNTHTSDGLMKMMIINLASARKHMRQSAQCEATLNTVDWSGSSYAYRICVAALREDIPEVLRLMPIVVGSNEVAKFQFRDWPVFDFVRDTDDFKGKFLEVFGEAVREDDAAKVEVSTSDDIKHETLDQLPNPAQEAVETGKRKTTSRRRLH